MRKKAISLILAVVMVFGFSGCETTGDLKKVNLNEVVHSIFYAPQYAAIALGYFEEEGLEINLTVGNGADKTMTALISGDADIGLMGMEAGIYVYNEGREDYAMAFAQLTQKAGNILISREEDSAFEWKNVIGKTIIGGRAGGMPQMILEYILRQNGIDPKTEVEILTNLQFTTTAGAFTGGIGDYTVEFDPSALALEKAGAGYAVTALGMHSGEIPYTVYMATQKYINENGDIIQSFTNAIQKGMTWVSEHSALEIAEVVKEFFPESSVEDLTFMIERYKEIGVWKESCIFLEDGFNLLQDIMEQGGELSQRVPYEKLITTKYAENAAK